MKKTVLFTGAGMSASFGYPLTSDILPLIVQSINDGKLFNDVTEDKDITNLYRTLLKELLICLSPGIADVFTEVLSHGELKKRLPMVTELLSQLEHQLATGHAIMDWNFEVKSKLLKPVKLNDRWEIGNLKTLFDWAIIGVIDINRPKSYSKEIGKFLEWVTKQNKQRENFISIVSTNYDVALEWELLEYGQAWRAHNEIDFGVSWREPILNSGEIHNRPSKPIHRILKLHGSTDWIKCRRCGFIYINPTEPIYKLTYENSKSNDNSCHCGYWPLQPLLVTMSYVRKMDEPNLLEIWRNTFEELRTADEWIIVGYSLPPEDFDIRSLFLRALLTHEKDLRVKVIQKDDSSKDRYDKFFGKDKYDYREGGFEANIAGVLASTRPKKDPFFKAKHS